MRHVVLLRACLFALLSFTAAPEARAQVPAPAAAPPTDPASIRLLTYNIRVENDAEGWRRRRDTVARVLNDDRFDVIAVQEANEMMIADYQAMLPNDYYVVGERSDGHRGDQKWYEFNPVFYNPKRFEKVDSGSIWVGEDPAKPGDTLLNSKWHGRVFTWLILRERTTGRRFAIGNVHVHGGRGEDAVRLVAKTLRAHAGGAPIVLLGDFNSAPDSEAYHRLTDPKALGLTDSLAAAGERSGGDVTILDATQSVPSGESGVKAGGQAKRIDYVFADPAWSVRSYRVVDSRISGETFASDHFPVAVTLRLADQAVPSATVESQLSPGVDYQKIIVPGEAPMVAHVVSIDLQHHGLRFAVTPADRSAGGETRARLTSDYLRASHALVAINGSYFLPFASGTSGGDDYYPHAGELADASGAVLSGGKTVSPPETALDIRINAMVCFRGLKVTIVDGQHCPAGATDGLAAGPRLLAGGEKRSFLAFDNRYAVLPAPRTAIGVSADGKKAWIVVVDGRQNKYSVGASLDALTKLFSELGASDAINLDGGGSSTLAARAPDGGPLVLNRPIHTDTPGRERPVANAILLLGK